MTTTPAAKTNGGDNNTGGGNNVEQSANTAVAPTKAKTEVFGEKLVSPAELPRTGASHVQSLLTLALSLLAAGIALRVTFSRRTRAASSPG